MQLALDRRGWSLADLQARSKIALSTMYRWRESMPHHRTSKQIADILGVSEAWLREGTGEMESESSVREMATAYKFTPRGPFPQPSSAPEFYSGCQAMLNAMTHATTTQAFDYAVMAFEDVWTKFKAAKYDELNQLNS